MQGGDPTGTGRGGESIYGYAFSFYCISIVLVPSKCSSFYRAVLSLSSHE